MKFHGTLEELQAVLADMAGEWTKANEDQHVFRNKKGAVLNWWPKTGTLQFQGPTDARNELEETLSERLPGGIKPSTAAGTANQPSPKQIFVVHGHDTDARDDLELALRRLGLEPFILMNTSGGGKTLIEALEGQIGRDYSSDFGISLITPDDFGYLAKDGPEKAEPRARQNVILETGMLLSSLTRERMALLVKGHVELPSDLQGIIQLRFNDSVKEIVQKLCARLQESGIQLDPAKVAAASG